MDCDNPITFREWCERCWLIILAGIVATGFAGTIIFIRLFIGGEL